MTLLTLRFYATGSFLQVVGDFMGVDKGTASRHIWKVTRAIAGLYPQFVKMPSTQEGLQRESQLFYNISRFPRCIGALDCTHVKIISPGGNNAEIYRNRKGFFSYNVQAVCDASGKFEDVVCRWPGSTHDSLIFSNSNVRAKFERGDFEGYVLVADSGYGVKNYLIPPLDNPNTPAEVLFNEAQIRTRNIIERVFGMWKRRFPILAYGIRLKREKVEALVIATAVLHNITKLMNDPEPPVDLEDQAAINYVNNMDILQQRQDNVLNINNIFRHNLINEYFTGLL